MICNREQDDDEELLVAVAVNNLAYICRDLGTERFAPFFQSCIEVIATLLSKVSPPEDEESDDLSSLKLMEAVSDALEMLASVYGAGFLPALPVLFPAITALASPTSSGKYLFYAHSRPLQFLLPFIPFHHYQIVTYRQSPWPRMPLALSLQSSCRLVQVLLIMS
jgi:hypothetical protein